MAIPATPYNYTLQQGNGQVYLSWSIVAGATSYSVQRSTDGGNTFASLATPSVNEYLDTSVTVGSSYWYKVASVNSDGTSAYTTPQQVVPTMPGQLSLGEVRLMAKQRADMVNSQFITDPEWNSYINQSYFELYDLLTNVHEQWYMADPLEFTTDGSTFQYPLPNGINYNAARPFYKMVGVDCGLNTTANSFITLNRFNFIDRNKFIYPNIGSTFYGVFNLQYAVVGDTIYFIPTPAAGQIIRVWYQPRLETLLKDSDVLDGVSGWSEYVIVDAAIKAMQKEESDVTVLAAQKTLLRARIEESAINRDEGQPMTISDTRQNQRINRGWGGPGNGSGGGF